MQTGTGVGREQEVKEKQRSQSMKKFQNKTGDERWDYTTTA